MEFWYDASSEDGSSGGLKGKMAPGDAHPYLALFYLGLIFGKFRFLRSKPEKLRGYGKFFRFKRWNRWIILARTGSWLARSCHQRRL